MSEVGDNISEPEVVEEVEEEEEKPKPIPEEMKHLNILTASIVHGQRTGGALSLQDAREYNKAKKCLTDYIEKEGDKAVGEEELRANNVLLECCQMLQHKGVFHLEGSEIILEAWEALDEYLNKNLNNKLKEQRVKNKFETLRAGKGQKKKGGNVKK